MRDIDFLGPPRIEALIVWNLESLDDLGHLRTPPSSKENTTLHETYIASSMKILIAHSSQFFVGFSVIIPTGDSKSFSVRFFGLSILLGCTLEPMHNSSEDP